MDRGDGVDPADFQRYFVKQGRFTAGTAIQYHPSLLTAEPTHQQLAKGLTIGMRFHSAPAIRLADGKPVHLGHLVKADARWRLIGFADALDPRDGNSRLAALFRFLETAPDPEAEAWAHLGCGTARKELGDGARLRGRSFCP